VQTQETIDALRRQVATLNDSLRVKSDEVRLLEDAFSQLKIRYDEACIATKAFKQNEQQLIAALTDAQTQLALSQTKFRALRIQAQEKLTNASQQIDAINSVSEREIAVLKAKLLKAESTHHARDDAWQQKDAELKIREAEVRNLTALCDELIAKLEARGGSDQR
jgi:chromosome segregation ATPase